MAIYSVPSNTTSLVDLGLWTNTVTNNYYGNVVFWIVVLVLFLTFKATDSKKAFAGAGFIGSIVAMILYPLGFISLTSAVVMYVLTGAVVIWLMFTRE